MTTFIHLTTSSHLAHVLLFDGLKKVVPVRAAGLGAGLQPRYEVGLGPLVHQVEGQVQDHGLEICANDLHDLFKRNKERDGPETGATEVM